MCGYTGHFFIYHGKWPFYRGKLPRCVWPDFPEINLPWEISMVTSKIAKKPLITLNFGKKQGFFDTQGKTANQISSTWKPPKIAFLNGFLSHCWEKDRWWHGRFHLKMKGTRKFWGKILNWFVGIDRTVGCSWTVKSNYIPSLNYHE